MLIALSLDSGLFHLVFSCVLYFSVESWTQEWTTETEIIVFIPGNMHASSFMRACFGVVWVNLAGVELDLNVAVL